MIVTLDIESIPCQDMELWQEIEADRLVKLEAELADTKAPGNYKKPEAIEEFITAKRAEMRAAYVADAGALYRKTALDGALGSVAVVGLAFGDGDPMSIDTSATTERDMLKGLMHIIDDRCTAQSRPCFVGHNVAGFDLRFLWQRCVILGVKPSPWIPFDAKPWDTARIYDTMTQWSPDRDKRISLKRLCRALGVPTSKGDIDGSKVWDYWQAGKCAEVAEYCRADVVATRECYRRMAFAVAA